MSQMTTNLPKDSDLPELPEPAEKGNEGTCCGNFATGGVYLDQRETICCGQPDERWPDYFTADQMRDYARKAIAAQTAQAVPHEDFDAWQTNPYTLVLQKSISEDYVPRADVSKIAQSVPDENLIVLDKRDLYDSIRAAWRNGYSDRNDYSTATEWRMCSDYANETIGKWESIKPYAAPPTQAIAVEAAWQDMTEYGQVKVGDFISFWIGDEHFDEQVKEVLNAGTDREELIYNKMKNYYVVSKNVLTGFGNVKQFRWIAAPTQGAKHNG